MNNLEKLLFSLFLLIFLLTTAFASNLRWYRGQMDNLLPVSMIENIYNSGKPLFPEVGIREALSLATEKPDVVCNAPLELPNQEYDNMFNWHTYLFLFLLAPFMTFFSAITIATFFTALSVVLLTGTTYVFLRRRNVAVLPSALFIVLLMCHPIWYSSQLGQLYTDRFFLGAFSLLIFLLTSKKKNIQLITVVGLICASINDRLGIISGVFIFGYLVLFYKDVKAIKKPLAILGMVLCACSIIAIKFVIKNQYYGSFGSNFTLQSILANFSDPTFTANLWRFLTTNLLLFGIFSLWNPRALLLCLGLMIPNILGNIGGAEKTGWTTHYHSTYFPVLVWASASGFASLYQRISSHTLRAGIYVYVITCSFLLVTYASNPGNTHAIKLENFLFHSLYNLNYQEIDGYLNKTSTTSLYLDIRKQLLSQIKPNSTVSLTEHGMPMLYGSARLGFYPYGLEQADYLLLPYTKGESDKISFGGFISYLPLTNDEKTMIDECLKERMLRAGFDVEHPLLYPANFALIKKM